MNWEHLMAIIRYKHVLFQSFELIVPNLQRLSVYKPPIFPILLGPCIASMRADAPDCVKYTETSTREVVTVFVSTKSFSSMACLDHDRLRVSQSMYFRLKMQSSEGI